MSEEVALAAGDIAHWKMRAEQAEAMLRTVTASLEQAEADAATAYEDAARICDREATEKTGEWRGPPDYRWGARKCAEYIRNHAAIADHPGAALLAEAEADAAALREALHDYIYGPQPFDKVRKVFAAKHPGAALLAELEASRGLAESVRHFLAAVAGPGALTIAMATYEAAAKARTE